MGRILGIYIHIPFCRAKCDYCDFYSIAGGEGWMDAYQKALLRHIKETAPAAKGCQVDTIYFGGGTPSCYGGSRLREILSTLRRHFSVTKGAEITLECNPDSVEKREMARLRRAGFNRFSLGMQTADEAQLCNLGRIHDLGQVEEAVLALREAKVENLSLDLIYGLPGQTMESFRASVEKAIDLSPEHLSLYGLKVEEGTPLHGRVLRGEAIPDDDCQADMYLWMVERLKRAGYRQYEISNFAKTGKESRHNLKYWMGREYLGFGPGAHSDFGGCRYAYRRSLEGYITGVLTGGEILAEREEIPKAERAREYLMLRLRTLRGIEEWEYRREFFRSFDPLLGKLELWECKGLVEQQGHRWHLTPAGFLLSNSLIGELLQCQEEAFAKSQEKEAPEDGEMPE